MGTWSHASRTPEIAEVVDCLKCGCSRTSVLLIPHEEKRLSDICIFIDRLWPASEAQVIESQCAPDWNGLSEELGSIPGPAIRFRVRIPAAHDLRLISLTGKRVRRCAL